MMSQPENQKKIVADFLALYAPKHCQPGDITIAMASTSWGIQASGAQKRLDEKVREGILEKDTGVILPNGKVGTVYRIIKKDV